MEITAIFICMIFLASVALTRACNLTAVSECTAIFSKNTNIDVLNDGISAIPTVTELNKMCGVLSEFKQCYEPKAADCLSDIIFSMTFGTIEKIINYLCIEGYNDTLQYNSCWNKTEVSDDTTQCHANQNEMITELKLSASQFSGEELRSKWCEIFDNTSACLHEAVDSRCGRGAACIMQTMMSRALSGLASLMKCPEQPSCALPTTVSASSPVNGSGQSPEAGVTSDTFTRLPAGSGSNASPSSNVSRSGTGSPSGVTDDPNSNAAKSDLSRVELIVIPVLALIYLH